MDDLSHIRLEPQSRRWTVSAGYEFVSYLPKLFRAGRWRIPEFQRPYVWEPKHVRALAESLLAGQPIGSLLIWTQYPTHWVLDGRQRTMTIAGWFGYGPRPPGPTLRILGYGLTDDPRGLPLAVPQGTNPAGHMMDWAMQRLELGDLPDAVLNATDDAWRRFAHYPIAYEQLDGDATAAVEAYRRLNTCGVGHDWGDIERAARWLAQGSDR